MNGADILIEALKRSTEQCEMRIFNLLNPNRSPPPTPPTYNDNLYALIEVWADNHSAAAEKERAEHVAAELAARVALREALKAKREPYSVEPLSRIEYKVEAQLHRVKQEDFPTIYKNLCAKQKTIELKRQEWYEKVTHAQNHHKQQTDGVSR